MDAGIGVNKDSKHPDEALEGMLKGAYTPEAAAAWVQDQLESYYD
ncbi:MAG: hypothetical protein PHI28_13085 [Mangrovibacterium sp.]|nr:hypothetical protein [Mangrovibacterium sp.]